MTAFNAGAYRITIVNRDVDGHRYFVGTVGEFPHVTVYEDSWSDAYTAIVGIIEDLYEQALASGEEFPMPVEDAPSYSGRVTVRIPKWLHQRLDEQANEQDVSLNFHISTLLTEGSNWIGRGSSRGQVEAFVVHAIKPVSRVKVMTLKIPIVREVAISAEMQNDQSDIEQAPATTNRISYDYRQQIH
jgi:hypothetical protein